MNRCFLWCVPVCAVVVLFLVYFDPEHVLDLTQADVHARPRREPHPSQDPSQQAEEYKAGSTG